jgi:hypothetical protein
MKQKQLFTHYLEEMERINLHKNHEKIYDKLPDNISDLQHIILYGPKGIGKYSQALKIIKKYSSTNLKYENKFNIYFQNKHNYFFKISDIHYEIDMSLLGCNTKQLWNEAFQQILDIISIKQQKHGIILCKYFHKIHPELLEIFYSYMHNYQSDIFKHNQIKFIIITEELSFLPENILNISNLIRYSRPTYKLYNKVVCKNLYNKESNLDEITNINNIKHGIKQLMNPHIILCNKIIEHITNKDSFNLSILRENLYDLLIYDVDIYESMWYIIKTLLELNLLKHDSLSEYINELYIILKQYNNNYRPIFHLERFVLYLCKCVYETN